MIRQMKGLYKISQTIIAATMVFASVQNANAAALRGRLVYPNGAPAAGITVTVYNQQIGRSTPVRTGPDGMYYLTIPPGGYYLEIWINQGPGAQPIVYPIQVGEPYTDIPPIVV